MSSEPTWNDYPTIKVLDRYHGTVVSAVDLENGDIVRDSFGPRAQNKLYLVANAIVPSVLSTNVPGGRTECIDLLGADGRRHQIGKGYPIKFKRIFTSHMRDMWAESTSRGEVTSSFKTENVSMCTECNVKLEWACMAERCPNCWRVYAGG